MPVPQPTPPAPRSGDRAAFVILTLAATLVGAVLLHAPRLAAIWVDDGVYLATGKALALGRGYRHLELPAEPLQTKYPPLYPLLLAGVWRIWPDYPHNIVPIQLINVTLWGAGSWFAYLLLRRAWDPPWWLALGGVTLGFISPATLGVLQTAMSEPLYFFLAALGLWSIARLTSAEHRRLNVAWTLLAALALPLAYLTRSIGVAAILAAAAGLVLARRPAALAVVALLSLGATVSWQTWIVHAARANAASPAFATMPYDLDYQAFLPRDMRTVLWVAYHNSAAAALAWFERVATTSTAWIDANLARGIRGGWPLYAGMAFTAALTVCGVLVARRRSLLLHVYLSAYLALCLAWPFAPDRFLVPILPFLFTALLTGMRHILAWLATAFSGREALDESSPAPPPRWTLLLTPLLLGALVFQNAQLIVRLPDRAALEATRQQHDQLVALIERHTPHDAVIAAVFGGDLYLRTGRKFVPPNPFGNPLDFEYPPDRPFFACGRQPSPQALAAARRLVEERLLNYLSDAGARYLVPLPPSTPVGAALAALDPVRAKRFRLVGTSDADSLFEIR